MRPIKHLERNDSEQAGHDRQPELLLGAANGDAEHRWKGLRLGAPLNRDHVLDHGRERQRREHIEMLVEAFQHRADCDKLGYDADQRRAGERASSSRGPGSPRRSANSEPNTPPTMPSWPAVKLITRDVMNIVLYVTPMSA